MDFIEKDRQYVWHPFTQMKSWMKTEDVLIIERGEGVYLYDIEGKRYMDGISSLWCNVHGHNRPEINNRIKGQIDKISHSTFLGQSSTPAIDLAERLLQIIPDKLSRVFYSDSGSEAMEIAAKIAFQYWQQCGKPKNQNKKTFVTLANSYHGDTIGSVSLGGVELFTNTYKPLVFKKIEFPTTYWYRSDFETPEACADHSIQTLENLLKAQHEEIVGVVVEPLVQGATGIITQPQGFLKRVEQLCRTYDVLLIVDEVATGFGRTGTMFACEQENVQPDIMAVAKGITGGYLPLAATFTTETIFNAFLGEFDENKTFFHGHTYTGNQLACAAALGSLDIFANDHVLERIQPLIAYMGERLHNEFRPHPHVGEVRHRGMIVGIEIVQNKKTREPFPYKNRMGHRVIMEARQRGVILRPLGDVLVILPPLSICAEELETLMTVASESIDAACTQKTQ